MSRRRNRLHVAPQGAPSRSRRPLVPGRGQGAGQMLPVEGPALFTPPALVVDAGQIEVSGICATTITVVGYPREVGPGWMEPLLAYPGRLDVALHIDPTPPAVAALRLRRQLGRLESGRRADAAAGRLADPELDAAAQDAGELARQVARGEARLFRTGLYLTVYADSREELAEEAARVTALAHSLLLTVRRARYRSVQGWVSTLPLGLDLLQIRRAMDTQALAAGIPFTTPDLPLPDVERPGAAPVVYGTNLHSAGIVAHDRWAQPNYNSVTTGASGAGKSFLMKLDLLRSLYQGVEAAIVDPEDEYGRLAAAVGGTRLALGEPGVHLNPLDLPAHSHHDPDLLTRRALFCHTLITTLLAGTDDDSGLGAGGRAALDAAILSAYRAAGITHDQATWTRPAPLLADIAAALTAAEDPAGPALAARLAPFVTGSHAGLFAHATTTSPTGHLVVYSLRALPDELKAAGTLLTLDAIWRTVADPARRRRRLVVVDEGWLLMAHPAGARFLFRLAKAARKHWAGLAVATQDSADLLSSELGRAVVANAATQILLRQDPTVIDDLRRVHRLTDGEATQLLTAGPGDALLLTGTGQRTALHALASPAEYDLITTDPVDTTTATPTDTGPLDPAWAEDPAVAATGPARAPRRPAARRPVDDDADPF
ncbi:Type IV secretory pathway VirB4 protein-like protein [Parafrankia sp. EAN1pec]|uniref:VirB4 family type IV secretion system protein n=1 Tax=Parafrankia sp. (strain EAN1pec) TaxID=298653 RepID=UPI0000543B5E|nr:Type IV secretory pathway VirB4 protein-like protein [Frankia sp. EAN1pec]